MYEVNSICICVCMYVCICVYVCVCICEYVYMYMCMYAYMYIPAAARMTCVQAPAPSVLLETSPPVYQVCNSIYVCLNVYKCMYICIYVYGIWHICSTFIRSFSRRFSIRRTGLSSSLEKLKSRRIYGLGE
jgi:hypothetical protein